MILPMKSIRVALDYSHLGCMRLHDELAEVAELYVGHSPNVTGKGEQLSNFPAIICA